MGRYTETPWGPPSDRHADRAWSREHLDRLRRRKVVQWGLVYVAAAWGFLQGLEYVSESFDWPRRSGRSHARSPVGLPIVLVLAWYHGDRGEQRISGTELTIITLLFLVGGGLFWLYDRGREASDAARLRTLRLLIHRPRYLHLMRSRSPSCRSQTCRRRRIRSTCPTASPRSSSTSSPRHPTSRSSRAPHPSHSRTKSCRSPKSPEALNVAHVLEGSVRTSGDKIRVTAQLIRAADSTHLWSETYDRTLNDIFAVQDEIADAIAQALQIKLAGGELTDARGVRRISRRTSSTCGHGRRG